MGRYRSTFCALLLLLLLLMSRVPATAQTQSPAPLSPRFGVEFGLGSHVHDGGNAQFVAFGYRPRPDMTVLVNVGRDYVPTRVHRYPDGYSATRGGLLAWASGEFRYTVPVGTRVSPYALAGTGFGLQRPNVNEIFPHEGHNAAVHVFYLGVGGRIQLNPRLDIIADGRFMLYATRKGDGFGAILPIRAGVGWYF